MELTVARRAAYALSSFGLPVAFWACDRSAPAGSGTVAWDSAGVEIVESREPVWGERAQWVIDPDPLVEIGTLDGDPSERLFQARDVTRLSDGRLVVANSGAHQLRFYDASGSHLLDVGREGAGPGEFEYLYRVWGLDGDSVVAFDNEHQRLTIYDPAGEMRRSVTLEGEEGS